MSHEAKQKAAFFRQSGWMMISALVGGGLMTGVHFLSKQASDYGSVTALLAATIIIPSMPLQMIFARETAAALATGNTRELASKVRWSLAGLFTLWLALMAVVAVRHGSIMEDWKIAQPVTLWLFALIILTLLLTPVFGGLMQGKQNFLWLGWTSILNALLRLGVAALIIFNLGSDKPAMAPASTNAAPTVAANASVGETGSEATRPPEKKKTAAGFMGGILAGAATVLLIMIWQTRDIWAGPKGTFAAIPFLREVTPLMMGFGACQLLFALDTVVVNRFFQEPMTGWYGSAGTLSRALMWLVLPLVSVMFPKLVHSSAKAEKSNLFGLTLLLTAGLAVVAGLGLSLFGALPVRIIFGPERVAGTMGIIPWFAAAMVPLTVANVLVNALLAKGDLRVVPWLAALAVGYAGALWLWHPSVTAVLQTLGGFTLMLSLAGAAFTWWLPLKTVTKS